jgi:AmmeMemoRadiSam system protein B
MKRAAAVAGQFYHGTDSRLNQQVKQYIDSQAKKDDAIGIVVPHAGFIYSGAVAGAVYSSINFPRTFVMLGPNHTGLGAEVSLMDEGEWEVPNGKLRIDRKLANRIVQNTPHVKKDSQAHVFEHSLEVQLPFIAYMDKEVQIVPIAVLSATLDNCRAIAEGISAAIRGIDYTVTILASTDMSHYLPDETARKKDNKAIDEILKVDPEGLYEIVKRERISMCGYLPTTVMLFASKLLGANTARIVKYMTSGEVSGDYDSVVGYAGIIIK